jgi:membrane protein YqaA with SNARE-associated domain
VTYLLAAAIVAAMTVTPLPLPPSWLVLSYLSLELSANTAGIVVAGAAGAAAGRTLLAWTARTVGPRFVRGATRDNVDYLAGRLHSRRGTWGAATLLAISPPPAGALYIAAGLLRINLAVVATACFAGRLVTYGIGVTAASIAADQVADRLREAAGPWSITLGIVLVGAALWVFARIDWRLLLERRRLRLRRG